MLKSMVILRVPTEMIDGILRRAFCPIFIFLSTFDSPESKSELIRIERLKPTMGIQEIYQNIITNRDGKRIDHSIIKAVTGFIVRFWLAPFSSNQRPSEVVELLKKPLSRSQSVKRRVRDDNASYAARQFGDPWFMGHGLF